MSVSGKNRWINWVISGMFRIWVTNSSAELAITKPYRRQPETPRECCRESLSDSATERPRKPHGHPGHRQPADARNQEIAPGKCDDPEREEPDHDECKDEHRWPVVETRHRPVMGREGQK